ncbi:MAG TPA: hypothetical protein VK915_14480 [Gaiellaceae bacterium]|nr:hypothetical protein [Gaiellaceae bacterium]
MLNGKLELHGFDAEAIAAKALTASLSASNCRLDAHEWEVCLSFLVVEVWRESERLEPSYWASFSTVAGRTCQRQLIDWRRQRLGPPSGGSPIASRPRPVVVSIDGLDDAGRDRLEQSVPAASNNPEDFVMFIETLTGRLDSSGVQSVPNAPKRGHGAMRHVRDVAHLKARREAT